MSVLPEWVQYVQALYIPFLAVIGAIFAYRHYWAVHNGLRLDLFDRRMGVYTEAKNFSGKVIRRGFPEDEDFEPFWRAREIATFLFDKDVQDYLKELNEAAMALGAASQKIDIAKGAQRQILVDRLLAQFQGFQKLDKLMVSVFSRYLRFSDVGE